MITLVLIFLLVLVPCSGLLSYFSRKIGADLQARVGPNRAGPVGILQPVADLLKMLQKEDAAMSATFPEQLSLAVRSSLLLSTVAILPLSSSLLLVDADMSAFLALWAGLSVSLISLFIGFQKGNMPGWLGGIRIASQAVTAAFPALIAMLCAGIPAGGFRWAQILSAQGWAPFSWGIVSSPFAPIAFVIFQISGLILFNVPPMDSGISPVELSGGISSSWGGRNLALIDLGRFYGFFLWSCMTASLFLGGWLLPAFLRESLAGDAALTILETLVLLIKAFALMLAVLAVSRVSSRTRTDQITGFCWRVLSPLSLFALVGCAAWKVWRG